MHNSSLEEVDVHARFGFGESRLRATRWSSRSGTRLTRALPPLGTQVPDMLRGGEEQDWTSVLQAAYRMGWLAPEDRARVLRSSAMIMVEVIRDHQVQVRSYPDDDRWLYTFLRELSAGMWRAG